MALLRSLLCVLLLAAAVAAQAPASSTAEEGASTAQQPATANSGERITDEDKRPGAGKAIARIPLYPLIGMGKALEKGFLAVEEHNLILRQDFAMRWLAERHMQPLFGGMGTGTGFALGINFFDNDALGQKRLRWEIPLRISTSNYQQFETRVQYALLHRYRMFIEGNARYRNRPEEDFFGLGSFSSVANRSNYKLQDRTIGAGIGSEFGKGRRISADVRFVNTNVGRGADNQYPDVETTFPGLPGLGRGSALLKYGVSTVLPWLDADADPQRGVRLRGRAYRVNSRNSDNFNFNEFAGSGEFYIPLGGPRTLAIHAAGDFRDGRDGGLVPFYAMPFLGGSRTLRGFREFRFYDTHAVLFNVEYRWRLWKLTDMVAFLDHGQVAPRLSAITLDGYRRSYGAGFRFRGAHGMALRFDIGHSKEGTRYYFSFGPEW